MSLIQMPTAKVPIGGSLCDIQVIPGYSYLIYENALGVFWRKDVKEGKLDLEEKANYFEHMHIHPEFLIIYGLVKQKKINSIDKLIFLYNIETPKEIRGKGYGKEALKKFEYFAKSKGSEYILSCATNWTEQNFLSSTGFENLTDNYWGKSLK